jgi:hypothetical protein
MGRYRKKPVEIEAQQLTVQNSQDVAAWVESNGGQLLRHSPEIMREGGIAKTHAFQIKTLEGWLWASFGDFVIRGVQGEFYPCKPDIFAASYEEVSA